MCAHMVVTHNPGESMKKTIVITFLMLALSVIGFAQKQKKSPEAADTPQDRLELATALKPHSFLNAGTMLEAQLQSTLDVEKSKPGDSVVLKTTKSIKQNGETIVPKGTSLIGHVTDVQRRTKDNTNSRIGLLFDRLQGQDLSSPITASIVSITNVQTAANVADDMLSSDITGSSSTSARSSGGSAAGGLLGGVTNTVGGVTNTVGGVTNTATQTLGSLGIVRCCQSPIS